MYTYNFYQRPGQVSGTQMQFQESPNFNLAENQALNFSNMSLETNWAFFRRMLFTALIGKSTTSGFEISIISSSGFLGANVQAIRTPEFNNLQNKYKKVFRFFTSIYARTGLDSEIQQTKWADPDFRSENTSSHKMFLQGGNKHHHITYYAIICDF